MTRGKAASKDDSNLFAASTVIDLSATIVLSASIRQLPTGVLLEKEDPAISLPLKLGTNHGF
jgi:hypothetical protein